MISQLAEPADREPPQLVASEGAELAFPELWTQLAKIVFRERTVSGHEAPRRLVETVSQGMQGSLTRLVVADLIESVDQHQPANPR